MELIIKQFDELDTNDLYDILQARSKVFVVEQDCVYNDIDGNDKNAYHIYLKDEEGIQAYLRVLDKGITFPSASLGRVLTLIRGCGLASIILEEGIKAAQEKFNADEIRIEAQTYAKGLYEKFGFIQDSDEFLEDGLPHIEMVLKRRKNDE